MGRKAVSNHIQVGVHHHIVEPPHGIKKHEVVCIGLLMLIHKVWPVKTSIGVISLSNRWVNRQGY